MTRPDAPPWSTFPHKQPSVREAEARAFVAMSREVLRALPRNPKGDPLEVARIAGIQAAKRTSELIPMCHPIPLTKVEVEAEVRKRRHRHSQSGAHHRRHRRRDGSPGRGFGGSSDSV